MPTSPKSVEEILAELEGSEDEPEDDGEGEDKSGDNPTIRQIRESQKHWQKQARDLGKALKDANATIAEFESKTRVTTAEGVFEQLGLTKKQAALYLATKPEEVSADTIKAFVKEYELAEITEGGQEDSETESTGFEPGGLGGAGVASSTKVPRTEWLKLAETDPAKAEKMFLDGRVDLSEIAAMDNKPGRSNY